jgi:hypothetical protein
MSDLMSVEQHTPGEELAEFEEEIDGVPVLVDVRAVTPATTSVIGAAQAVVVASRPARRGGEALEIVASRRFMVDIHLLDKPGR